MSEPVIWALHCPFRKDGAPVMGSFGRTIKPVIVMEMETWIWLCKNIPQLAAKQFRVGTAND